ncbi:hypothetical protein N7528_002179 [Penicillium herquei]|nr:hypothetical protein N7528_002179 [Penicillium herquei]
MSRSLFQGLVVGLFIFVLYRYRQQRRALIGLPPGPRPVPLLGNVRDLPPKGSLEYRHWLTHKDVYGPVSSVTVLGHTLIFMHSREAAREILEKNAHKSAGRPSLSWAVRMCGYDKLLPFLQNDETHVRGRKAIHQQINTPAAAARTSHVLHVEVRRFLKRVLDRPTELCSNHLWGLATAIILKLTYGYSVDSSRDDPLVELIEVESKNFTTIATPMAWLVDVIPALDYLPAGFPGAAFKETAKEWKALLEQAVDVPYEFVVEQRKRQSHRPSFVSGLLDEVHDKSTGGAQVDSEEENFIKWTAITLFGASADTTVATIEVFIAAMIKFPKVQEKAQEEIDRVIGSGRLPCLADRDKLPYLDALTKEVSRWAPVVPMGAAHLAQEDMSYDGHRIPTGAFLLPAVWWFCHDPEVYPSPDAFDPTRYLSPRNEPDPRLVTFGFGRRVCAGQNFAERTNFLSFAAMLSVFRISKAVDAQGNEIDIQFELNPGVVCHPKAHAYKIAPRSAAHAELIRSAEAEYPPEESDAVHLDLSKTAQD